jgi:hypothetical protein
MREMGWTWQELEDTPWYVRRFTSDLLMARREAENAAQEKANRGPGHG